MWCGLLVKMLSLCLALSPCVYIMLLSVARFSAFPCEQSPAFQKARETEKTSETISLTNPLDFELNKNGFVLRGVKSLVNILTALTSSQSEVCD